MDLYAPITQSLSNTQSTIVELMKVFIGNEIAKQGVELEKTKLAQGSRALDLEAERNTQAAAKERAFEERSRQAREDSLRNRGEDVAFRNIQEERLATHEANATSLGLANLGLHRDQLAEQNRVNTATIENQKNLTGIHQGQLDLSKKTFEKQFGNTTVGQIGQQFGIDPFVWGYMNIDKDAVTTPDHFQKMMTTPQMLAMLPRAAIIRHNEQLKTIEKSILAETDPAKKEQMKTNYDNLSNQVQILRDTLDKGPPKELLGSMIKAMGITDPEEAAKAVETLSEKWKGIKSPQDLAPGGRPSDKFNEAPKIDITPEIKELTDYFKKKNPAALVEAAAISEKQGQAAALDFLRKKRGPVAAPQSTEPVFGIRPGSVLADIAAQRRQSPNDYEPTIDPSALTY